jgi:hypothetical protein
MPALLTREVEIATLPMRGVTVKAYAPPSYSPEEEADLRDRQRGVLGVGQLAPPTFSH